MKTYPTMFVTVLLALIATLNVSCTVVEESRMAGNGNGGPPMYPQPSRERFMMEDREALAHRPYPQDPRMQPQPQQPVEQPFGRFKAVQTGRDHYNGRLRNGEVHWTLNGAPVSASEVPQQAKAGFDAGLRQRGYTGPIRHVDVSHAQQAPARSALPPTLPEDQRVPLENLPEPDGGSLLPPYPADDGAAPPLPEWAPSAPSSQFVRA